ncbi:hypothetical protein J6590_010735 [Homalodisca vitripennis]|nr:hypothetical protein J6590_010735 [Homalodisca vitripennis]
MGWFGRENFYIIGGSNGWKLPQIGRSVPIASGLLKPDIPGKRLQRQISKIDPKFGSYFCHGGTVYAVTGNWRSRDLINNIAVNLGRSVVNIACDAARIPTRHSDISDMFYCCVAQ